MYILEPVFHETIWGGKELGKYINRDVNKLGHLYLVSGRPNMSNIIVNGNFAGQTLCEVFKSQKEKWNMSEYQEFPLTIALVDATENLSIQVHPDDETAERLENLRVGKTESWLFLKAPGSGWIYGGCQCETKEQVKKAVENGNMEEITRKLPVQKGDYVCIEDGMLHAMTAGSVVYEIEYGGDLTYRFYDYERKDSLGQFRELHIEKAIEAIKPGKNPQAKVMPKYEWVSETSYEICRMQGVSEYKNSSKEMECISIVEGYGCCDGCKIYGGMSILLLPGEKLENLQLEDIIIARIKR